MPTSEANAKGKVEGEFLLNTVFIQVPLSGKQRTLSSVRVLEYPLRYHHWSQPVQSVELACHIPQVVSYEGGSCPPSGTLQHFSQVGVVEVSQ